MTWQYYHAVNLIDGTEQWFKTRVWSPIKRLRKTDHSNFNWSICLVEEPVTQSQYDHRIIEYFAYNSIHGKHIGNNKIQSRSVWIWKTECLECGGPIIQYPNNKWWTKHKSDCETNTAIGAVEAFLLS